MKNMKRSKLYLKEFIPFLFLSLSTFAEASEICEFKDIEEKLELVERIKSSDENCYKNWFDLNPSDHHEMLNEDVIFELSIELENLIKIYDGNSEQAKRLRNISEFIRAAYYIKSNSNEDDYSNDLSNKIAYLINDYLENPAYKIEGLEQEKAFYSLTLLVDNIRKLAITFNHQFDILKLFNNNTDHGLYWAYGINNLFRAMAGHESNAEFYDFIANNNQLIYQLENFIYDNELLLDSDYHFIIYNMVREISRLINIPDNETKNNVITVLDNLRKKYPIGSRNEKISLIILETTSYYGAYITSEELSNLKENLATRVLPNSYECIDNIIIRSQELNDSQLNDICLKLKKC